MLDSMKKKKGIFPKVMLWTLLILGTVGLTFFGMFNEQLFPAGGAVADVNRDRISLQELSRAIEQRRQQGGGMQAGGRSAEEQMLRDQALESLIQRKLIVQEARDIPVVVPPDEVVAQISEFEVFQQDGRFSPTKYREILRDNGIKPRVFEDSLRENSLIQKLSLAFQSSLRPLSLYKKKEDELKGLRVNVEYVEVSPSQVQSREFTEAQVEEFLADSANQDRVKEIYEQRKDSQYSQPEQTQARQIFIPSDVEKARELATEISGKVDKEPFEKLVQEYSRDEFSKSKGGDLGYFARGVHEPEFDQVVFNTEPGQVTKPIKTSQGYHIVKVEDRRPASTQELAEVRQEIAKELLREEYAERLVASLSELVRSGEFDKIPQVVKDHRLDWKETGYFDLAQPMVPQIGASDTFIRTAFSLNQPGEYAKEPVRIGEKTFFVRLKERQSELEPESDMEGFGSQIEQFMAQRRTEETFSYWIDHLRKEGDVHVYEAQF